MLNQPAHKLRAIRQSLGLTVAELSELSGISPTTIHRIESGDRVYKIQETVAAAIADALYMRIWEIFMDEELSHLGRPARTGKPVKVSPEGEVKICPGCRLELPRTLVCDTCDGIPKEPPLGE